MVTLRPFCAMRPIADRVEQFACVPYDVINGEEARDLANGNSISLLHATRSEIDLPEGTDVYSESVYQKAFENLQYLKKEVPLLVEDEPCLYVYRQIMNDHQQIGIVGCCAVNEYDNNVIRKHERTRNDKEDDRTRHITTLRTQVEPVFLTYQGQSKIDDEVNKICEFSPLYDFTSTDGIRHTVWKIENTKELAGEFLKISRLYIADGHHRSAGASRARAVLREKNKNHTGSEEYNYFLAVLFPAEQLRILSYNRVVKDLNGRTPKEFLLELKNKVEIRDQKNPNPSSKGNVSMYLEGEWYSFQFSEQDINQSDSIKSLDVSLLQELVLAPLLNIQDPRTDKRIDFVGGIRGTDELVYLVDSKKAAVAFSMFPTLIEDLMKVADANEIMPPKSTWFEPKLRSGLFMYGI